MKYVCLVFLMFVIAGCQSNNIGEIVNKHGNIDNIELLNTFVKNVDNGNKSELTYISYGIDGQRGVKTITYNGEIIKVSFLVDGKPISEYECNDIKINTEKEGKKYMFAQCTGDAEGNVELVTIEGKESESFNE